MFYIDNKLCSPCKVHFLCAWVFALHFHFFPSFFKWQNSFSWSYTSVLRCLFLPVFPHLYDLLMEKVFVIKLFVSSLYESQHALICPAEWSTFWHAPRLLSIFFHTPVIFFFGCLLLTYAHFSTFDILDKSCHTVFFCKDRLVKICKPFHPVIFALSVFHIQAEGC